MVDRARRAPRETKLRTPVRRLVIRPPPEVSDSTREDKAMRPFIACAIWILLLAPAVRAAPNPDPALANGLQACVTNGLQAGLYLWYADQPRVAAELDAKTAAVTKGLGSVIDTEVVAVQTVSKRVTRYYVAVYFMQRPLWLEIQRYAGRDHSTFLPLKFSLDPDAILPGYLTDFLP